MSSKRSRPTSATAALPSSTRPLRFASWNVLADSLLRQNSWLYQSCDPEALHDRLPRIFNGVERLEPDVLAMQEVEHFARDMEPRLSELGFSGVYKQRTGDDQTDGVALVWRNERLAAEQIEYVEYASALTAGVKDPRSLEMLKKHNVAIIALLRDLESGKLLVVATTHILWNPRRGWVKLQQLNHLFARVDAMRRGAAATEAAVDVTSNDVGTTSCGESADDGGIGQSTGRHAPCRSAGRLQLHAGVDAAWLPARLAASGAAALRAVLGRAGGNTESHAGVQKAWDASAVAPSAGATAASTADCRS